MITTTIDTSGMDRLSSTLERVAAVSRRSPAEIVKVAAGQVLMGNENPRLGATFPGLWQLALRDAPAPDAIPEEQLTALQHGGAGIRVRARAYAQADAIMSSAPSILARPGVGWRMLPARIGKRGKRIRSQKGRVATLADGRQAGDRVLNRQALAVFRELVIRNAGRTYTAQAFTGRVYRREIASQIARGADSVSRRAQITNRTGTVLGTMDFQASGEGAAFHLANLVDGAGRPVARARLNQVMSNVRADKLAYLLRKELSTVGLPLK